MLAQPVARTIRYIGIKLTTVRGTVARFDIPNWNVKDCWSRWPTHPPYAFTEQGVAMLSSVLNSKRAVQVNIVIMRAFVKLRELLSSHTEILRQLDQLERKYERHDVQIKAVFHAIRRLVPAPTKSKRRIGFSPAAANPASKGN